MQLGNPKSHLWDSPRYKSRKREYMSVLEVITPQSRTTLPGRRENVSRCHTRHRFLQIDSKQEPFPVPVKLPLAKPPLKFPAIRQDDALRCDIVRVGGDIDVRQSALLGHRQHESQRASSIPATLSPGNDRISDVTETIRGQLGRPGTPNESRSSHRTRRPTSTAENRAVAVRASHPAG
jgi:hypothetical protein